jgi:hypothetical protein
MDRKVSLGRLYKMGIKKSMYLLLENGEKEVFEMDKDKFIQIKISKNKFNIIRVNL